MAKKAKTYRAVAVGETFPMAGWRWTVVEVAPDGKTFQAETPRSKYDPTPMRREFSAEEGEPYYGEPDRDDEEDLRG